MEALWNKKNIFRTLIIGQVYEFMRNVEKEKKRKQKKDKKS